MELLEVSFERMDSRGSVEFTGETGEEMMPKSEIIHHILKSYPSFKEKEITITEVNYPSSHKGLLNPGFIYFTLF